MFNVCRLISELLVSQTYSWWNFQLGSTESQFSDFSEKAVVLLWWTSHKYCLMVDFTIDFTLPHNG